MHFGPVIFIFGMLAICIAVIIVFGVKFLKVINDVYGRDEIRKAAEEEAKNIRLRDPVITCDYCGCKVDTREYKVCPHCGGAYNLDSEWLKRHKLDEKTIQKTTNNVFKNLKKSRLEKKVPELKRARKNFWLSFVPLLLFVLFIVFSLMMANRRTIRKTEKLNVDSLDKYVEADYKIVGDGVIFDDGEVTVTLKGFYVQDGFRRSIDDNDYAGEVKAEITVKNNRKEPVQVTMACNCINGVAKEYSGFFVYDWFAQKKETTVYEEFYNIPFQTISELVFTRCEVSTRDYRNNKSLARPVTITTTADFVPASPIEGKTLMFSNDLVDIYYSYIEIYERYGIYVVNKSDEILKIYDRLTYDLDGPDQTVYTIYIFNEPIPPGYIATESTTDLFMNEPDKDTVYFSLMFEYPNNPGLGFSTGYIEIKRDGTIN